MTTYMFLFHEPPDLYQGLSPEETRRIIQKFTDWRRALENDGCFVSGQKLSGHGRTLRRRGLEVAVTDGPFSEGKEILGGYFLIEADGYEHALQLARGFPLNEGAVEIRELESAKTP